MAMRTNSRQTQLFSMRDFTGGLNLTTDAYKLKENESPDLLNVDLDKKGGFQVRRGVAPYSSTALSAAPDTIWTYNYLGTVYTLVQIGTVIWKGTGSTWTTVGTSLGSASTDVCPVTFDNNSYWARGNADVAKLAGSVASTMGVAFNDTITATSGNVPRADHMAVHSGYMWVAGTWESGVHYPNRIRWSWANTFTNTSENWRTDEYIEIDEGKDFDPITAIVPFGDQLIVFKKDSVFAVYGEASENFSIVNITNTVGSVSHAATIATPSGIFFFDQTSGVNVTDGRTVKRVFDPLLPALLDDDIPRLQLDKVDMGWINNRLWVSVPWTDEPTPPRGMTFVLDPALNAWTKYSLQLGPYVRGYRTTDSLAYIYGTNKIFKLDVAGQYFDDLGSSIETINAYYRTRWVDLNEPAIKKRWRRTEVLMQVDQGYDLPVVSYSDYDPTISIKNFVWRSLGSTSTALEGVWDNPSSNWDTATWAKSGVYGYVDRGSTLGIARSVSLKIGGQVETTPHPINVQAPVFWGVDALIFKYVPRRIR